MQNIISKVLGYILLTPGLFSVVCFFLQLLTKYRLLQVFSGREWTGLLDYAERSGGGGYTSALPFYFGLMAIAGAYLIKDSKK